jgi:hypothetical protein
MVRRCRAQFEAEPPQSLIPINGTRSPTPSYDGDLCPYPDIGVEPPATGYFLSFGNWSNRDDALTSRDVML